MITKKKTTSLKTKFTKNIRNPKKDLSSKTRTGKRVSSSRLSPTCLSAVKTIPPEEISHTYPKTKDKDLMYGINIWLDTKIAGLSIVP